MKLKLSLPILKVGQDRKDRHELKVPMLRVRKDNALSPTILRHLILLSIKTSAQENRHFTRITEKNLEDFALEAIAQDNFFPYDGEWLKANLATIQTASELSIYLKNLTNTLPQEYNFCSEIADSLADTETVKNIPLIASIERSLYPAKIIDAEIPNFIIPIRPGWAEDLFDEELAKQNLFGARKELALKREIVYYSKVKNFELLKAPGRILWYVSQGKQAGYHQVKAIRACSRLDEVIIDTPKFLFTQFRRLGVYSFQHVLQAANNKLDNKIMAIKFSDTEMFNTPIYFQDVQKVLENNFTFQSPYKINAKQFYQLYNKGIYQQEI